MMAVLEGLDPQRVLNGLAVMMRDEVLRGARYASVRFDAEMFALVRDELPTAAERRLLDDALLARAGAR